MPRLTHAVIRDYTCCASIALLLLVLPGAALAQADTAATPPPTQEIAAPGPELSFSFIGLPFKFNALSTVISTEPEVIVFIGYYGDSATNRTLRGYALEEGALSERFSFEMVDLGGPRLWLGQGQMLARRTVRSTTAPAQSYMNDITFNRYDFAAEQAEPLLTLAAGSEPDVSRGLFPPCWWCESYGLSLFIYNFLAQRMELWQGSDKPELVQTVEQAMDYGWATLDGKTCFAVFTATGQALLFSEATGRLEESPEYAALAQANVKQHVAEILAQRQPDPVPQQRRKRAGAFCPGLAVWTTSEGLEFITAEGKHSLLPYWDCFALKPDGSARDESEQEMASFITDYFFKEGREQPPQRIDRQCKVVPVDDSRVGILDIHYNRLVLVGVAPTTDSGQ